MQSRNTIATTPEAELELIRRARNDATRLADENAPVLRRAAGFDLIATEDAFPGYATLTELHRGAQGIVYHAVQLGTGRNVAIKVVHAGPLAAERDARRFEREVAALSHLRHPNIVAIHDSGVLGDLGVGRFLYFVMDFIDGPPLDQWVNRQGWSADASGGPNARGARRRAARSRIEPLLRLFIKICDAVNAAHLRGVLHRDLKPSNVRVDAAGEPQVLDFGLAKFTTDDLGAGSSAQTMTVTGQFVGSLPWASPEQAEGRIDVLDLRSDVYSLGVLLYQLLTGRFPYDTGGGLRKALESIASAVPIRPRTLRPEIDDELETIVLKCLRKEPARRYDTAGELARDLRRYLNHDPIEAKRESGWYMFKKAIRRHRAPAFASALFLALLIIGFGIALMFWQRAARERAAAQHSYAQALDARSQAEAAIQAETVARATAEAHLARALAAEAQAIVERDRAMAAEESAAALRQEAEAAAARAETVSRFLQDTLATTDPDGAAGARVTVEGLLDQATRRVEAAPPADEAVTSTLMATIGRTYLRLGLPEKAEQRYQAALAARIGAEVATVIAGGDRQAALAKFIRAVRERGNYGEVEDLIRQMLLDTEKSLGSNHPQLANALVQLGGVLRDQGRSAEAEPMLRRALDIYRLNQGDRSADAAGVLSALGWVAMDQGRLDEAQMHFQAAIDMRVQLFGPNDESAAWSRTDLGYLAQRRENYAEAEQIFRSAQAVFAATKGPDSNESIDMLGNIAQARRSAGDLPAAEALLREVVAAQQANERPDPFRLGLAMDSLGWVLMEQSDFAQAESVLMDAHALRASALGADHPSTLMSLRSVAAVHARRGDDAQAATWLGTAAESYAQRFGDDAWQTAEVQLELGETLVRMGRDTEAEPLLLSAFATLGAHYGKDAPLTQRALRDLFDFYTTVGRPAEAERYQSQSERP